MLSMRARTSTRFLTFLPQLNDLPVKPGHWLADRDFSVPVIGTAVACSLMTRAVTEVVIYPTLHRHATLLRLARIVPWMISAAAVPCWLVDDLPMLVILSIVFRLAYSMMLRLSRTIATVAAKAGLVPHGPTRSFGSAGFVLCTVVAGWARFRSRHAARTRSHRRVPTLIRPTRKATA